MTQESAPPLLQLRGITKRFPGALANDQVDLSLKEGEIHALLGENGAGKSTLVKIIYGILKADAGDILWRGEPIDIRNPAFARALGVAMVFQHFSLFESLTVVENIALGLDEQVDMAALEQQIRSVSESYGLPLDPKRHVHTLSVGERQRIEIVRCLLQKPKVLVMDEPTSVLTPQEVEKLFTTLRRLSDEGMAILYISHKLDEIRALCHSATILRHGVVVGDADPRQETAQSLAALMIGEEVQAAQARANAQAPGSVRLNVKNLSLEAEDEFGVALKSVELQVRAGEILGVAGVAGNGQVELLKALSGERTSNDPNAVSIDTQLCGDLGPTARRAMGLCCVPEERLGHGAVPDMSLSENAFLTANARMGLTQNGLIRFAECASYAKRVIESFRVKCAGDGALANSLSGGNLQKFIIGREVLQNPNVLAVSQPTWGVDAGAAAQIRKALIGLAEQGAAVLVISQDLDELREVSDSLAAICDGHLSPIFPASSVTTEELGLLMGGSFDTVTEKYRGRAA